MRSRYVPLAAMAFVVACADAPTAPLLQPDVANFALDGRAPPPWALIEGTLETDGSGELTASFSRIASDGAATMSHDGSGVATYRAWLLVTPGNQAQLLRFTEGGTNVTFSNGAMLSNVNGKVTGRGTMIVDGHLYQLSAVTQFEANGDCATTPWDEDGPLCASFSAGDGSFSSEASVWTGILSNDGGNQNPGPPFDDCLKCVIVCPDCVYIGDPIGKPKGPGR